MVNDMDTSTYVEIANPGNQSSTTSYNRSLERAPDANDTDICDLLSEYTMGIRPVSSQYQMLVSTTIAAPRPPVNFQAEADAGGTNALNVAWICICVFGLIGNIAVIVLVLREKDQKNGMALWYVLQLAIADTIFLSTIPFQVIENKNSGWIFPQWLCKVKQGITYLNYYSTVLFLTVMAFDRYIAVCCNLSGRLRKLRTRRAIYIITVTVWMVSLAFSVPVASRGALIGFAPKCECQIDFRTSKTPEERCAEEGMGEGNLLECCLSLVSDHQCLETDITMNARDSLPSQADIFLAKCYYGTDPMKYKYFLVLNATIMFLLPLCVIAVCYALIIRHLRNKSFHGSQGRSDHRLRAVIYMCASLVVVFLVCWLPYHAQHMAKLWGIKGRSTVFCETLIEVTSLLVYLNSAIDPFIYFIVSRIKGFLRSIRSSVSASAVITLFSRNDHSERVALPKKTPLLEEKDPADEGHDDYATSEMNSYARPQAC